jgi:hypothetical protein
LIFLAQVLVGRRWLGDLENFFSYFFENQAYSGVIECGESEFLISILGMRGTKGGT